MTDFIRGKRFSGLSVLGFVCSWLLGPLGIILSALAVSEINNNPDTLRGKGLAKWGIAIGSLGTVALVFSLWLAHENAELQRANDRADQALQNYFQNHP